MAADPPTATPDLRMTVCGHKEHVRVPATQVPVVWRLLHWLMAFMVIREHLRRSFDIRPRQNLKGPTKILTCMIPHDIGWEEAYGAQYVRHVWYAVNYSQYISIHLGFSLFSTLSGIKYITLCIQSLG